DAIGFDEVHYVLYSRQHQSYRVIPVLAFPGGGQAEAGVTGIQRATRAVAKSWLDAGDEPRHDNFLIRIRQRRRGQHSAVGREREWRAGALAQLTLRQATQHV